MQIFHAPTTEILRVFMGKQTDTNITHFHVNLDGTINCFNLSKCDKCENMGISGNPITFAVTNVESINCCKKVGLEESDVIGELECSENGDIVCPRCFKKEIKRNRNRLSKSL